MLGSSSRCLSEREMLLSSNRFERAVFGYVVLFVVVIGVAGNVLNFTVLLAPPMRSRFHLNFRVDKAALIYFKYLKKFLKVSKAFSLAIFRSWLLSALAVCDIFFLLFMLPHSLAHYELFAFNYTFRNLYVSYKINLLAFTNWASAAAIWLALFRLTEKLQFKGHDFDNLLNLGCCSASTPPCNKLMKVLDLFAGWFYSFVLSDWLLFVIHYWFDDIPPIVHCFDEHWSSLWSWWLDFWLFIGISVMLQSWNRFAITRKYMHFTFPSELLCEFSKWKNLKKIKKSINFLFVRIFDYKISNYYLAGLGTKQIRIRIGWEN